MLSRERLLLFYLVTVILLIGLGPNIVTAQTRCARVYSKDLYQHHLQTIEKNRSLELQTWQVQKEGDLIVSLTPVLGKVVYRDVQFSITSGVGYEVTLSGVEPETSQREEIGVIQIRFLNEEKTSAKIGWINTLEKFRSNDIASLLLSKVLEANPQIKSLSAGLAGVNLATIGKYVYGKLKSHPLFDLNAVRVLENSQGVWGKRLEYNYVDHIRACCSRVPKEVFQSLAIEALLQAPAYKYRAKFGFTNIEVISFDFFASRNPVQFILSREN